MKHHLGDDRGIIFNKHMQHML